MGDQKLCSKNMDFSWEKLCTFLVSYIMKNVGRNRAKRFLENSLFLVRVAINFLVPREEFKTEKIPLPNNISH